MGRWFETLAYAPAATCQDEVDVELAEGNKLFRFTSRIFVNSFQREINQ
jgi:hypothetical protein